MAQSSLVSGSVVGLYTGTVDRLPHGSRFVASAIGKHPRTSLELLPGGAGGDEHGDTKNHGGPDKAVFCYPSEHYAAWASDGTALAQPAFGENVSLVGVMDADVPVGARGRLGAAKIQVSAPRRPCFKPGAFNADKSLPTRILRTGRTGWYLRVVEPGRVELGDELVLTVPVDDRSALTCAELFAIMQPGCTDLAQLERALTHPWVSDSWKSQLRRRGDRLRAGLPSDEPEVF